MSKADAQAWLTNADSQIARGTWAAPAAGRLTVDEVAERWLASNPLKRVSSVERDRSILRHILPVLGPWRLAQVSRADLQKMVDRWVLRYSPSTVGRMASVLMALFSYAVDAELVARSPASGLRLPRTRLVERPVLTADDLERFAKALGPDDAPMMWLGVIGGLRWAECAGLAVRDLDLLSSTVSVRQQLGRDGRLGPPKSEAGKRRLAVPTWVGRRLGRPPRSPGPHCRGRRRTRIRELQGVRSSLPELAPPLLAPRLRGSRSAGPTFSRPPVNVGHRVGNERRRHKDSTNSARARLTGCHACHICRSDGRGRSPGGGCSRRGFWISSRT